MGLDSNVEHRKRESPATSPAMAKRAIERVAALGRPTARHRKVVASWSGGIDSTAVLAHLAARGYDIWAVTLAIYGANFGEREQCARDALMPELEALSKEAGGSIRFMREVDSSWIWAFSPDGVEIPRRNKHIIDRLITNLCIPEGIKNIALGEYTGGDTWLVRDHVGSSDADHRALASYIYMEYGLDYRLISLQDFGESRYKVDRCKLLAVMLSDAAFLTTVCLVDSAKHCGECYKCVERHAAFMLAVGRDETEYERDPSEHQDYHLYRQQMRGFDLNVSRENFPTTAAMPTAAAAEEAAIP